MLCRQGKLLELIPCHPHHLCLQSFFFLLLTLFFPSSFFSLFSTCHPLPETSFSPFCKHTLLIFSSSISFSNLNFTRSQFLCNIADGQDRMCSFDYQGILRTKPEGSLLCGHQDPQHGHHLGYFHCQKCRVLGPILNYRIPIRFLTRYPKLPTHKFRYCFNMFQKIVTSSLKLLDALSCAFPSSLQEDAMCSHLASWSLWILLAHVELFFCSKAGARLVLSVVPDLALCSPSLCKRAVRAGARHSLKIQF